MHLALLLLLPVAADDPKALLLAVREKALVTLNNLPKYLCTETIDRSLLKSMEPVDEHSCDRKANAIVRQTASDRLRLDVAVSGDGEMYSWVGEDRFQDQSLADLVGGGATSTGAFATFLGSIFGSNDARFTYNGTSGPQAEFGFAVPTDKSHYTVGDRQPRSITRTSR